MKDLSDKIGRDEEATGVVAHRSLDAGLMEITFEWASGSELIDILSDDLTAGDFVRTMKQLVDLLRQLALIAPSTQTKQCAEQAAQSILRGVVAASQGSSVTG
jgi:ATP-dependent RNA helicase HelY